MRAIFVLMLLILGGAVHASDWISVGKSDNEHLEFLIDTSSIRVSGDIRRAWIKYQFASRTEQAYAGVAQKWVTYRLSRNAFDCGVGSSRAEGLTVYFEDGTYHTPTYIQIHGVRSSPKQCSILG
jgi:hypothetical protein